MWRLGVCLAVVVGVMAGDHGVFAMGGPHGPDGKRRVVVPGCPELEQLANRENRAFAAKAEDAKKKGEDANKPVRLRDHQPRLEKLANQKNRIYGSCSDIDKALRGAPSSMPILSIAPAGRFCYVGDAKALSTFLEECAALDSKEPVSVRDKRITLILHPGQARLKEGRPYDWEMHWEIRMQDPKVSGINEWRHFHVVTRIDAWLGGKVSLDQLEVPSTIIEVKSGGEIEKFIAEHEARRKEAGAND